MIGRVIIPDHHSCECMGENRNKILQRQTDNLVKSLETSGFVSIATLVIPTHLEINVG